MPRRLKSVKFLESTMTEWEPRAFVETCGEIFAEFGEQTQGSGNISHGVRTGGGERFFVKTAGLPEDSRWTLTFPERVAALRNGGRIACLISRPALPRLRNVIESAGGPLLVYERRTGEMLGVARAEREKTESAYQRFRALPARNHGRAGCGLRRARGGGRARLRRLRFLRRLPPLRFRRTPPDRVRPGLRQGAFTNTMGRLLATFLGDGRRIASRFAARTNSTG
ncbi:MAG: hypothetical protein H7145_20735 [Akkermansiaceae bacterium]|nr:hypothetical protein [Armatimonadota bacterium]